MDYPSKQIGWFLQFRFAPVSIALSNEPVIMWEFTFLTGYVDGCEEITINGITGDTNVTIDKSIIICK